jgi:hypothetical protein
MVSLDNIWNAIEKIGYENVVQVITNNAIVCKSANHIIENKYLHIGYSHYDAHGIVLVFENIGK